jgi:hypothetical protein
LIGIELETGYLWLNVGHEAGLSQARVAPFSALQEKVSKTHKL